VREAGPGVMALRSRGEDGVFLSDYEQRVLAEIERDLITDDPRFAAFIGPRTGITPAVWAIAATLGLCCGLGCLALGVIFGGGVGATVTVTGLVLIVASCWAAVRACRSRRSAPPPGARA
jgi:Flp pilus assembly protein TadB